MWGGGINLPKQLGYKMFSMEGNIANLNNKREGGNKEEGEGYKERCNLSRCYNLVSFFNLNSTLAKTQGSL